MRERTCIAIDLKSFYASAECADRRLDPLDTHLVVADESRSEKTICLAVSPALKACGIPGRARLFEVRERVRELNARRRSLAPGRRFSGRSTLASALAADPSLELDFVIATPRMARYIEVSSQICGIYLKYVAPEDIHVYSIDEVFLEATSYLRLYRLTAREFAMKLIQEVLQTTGITATAGIGPNLYLGKIAMDIVAKHIPADRNGVRIAELDEAKYRRELWTHRPLTDFWRVGHGYAARLEAAGMYTMGDIARMSVQNEEILYRMFGVNAELLIDHAWGWEPVTVADIKAYRPEHRSLCSGQVLQEPYEFDKARLVVMEMVDQLALDLVEKRLTTDHLELTVGYDVSNLTTPERRRAFSGAVRLNRYGRQVPKEAHGSVRLEGHTASAGRIVGAVMPLFDRIVNRELLVRRITLGAGDIVPESAIPAESAVQPDLFADPEAEARKAEAEQAELDRETRLQHAILAVRKRLGKNALIKGMSLQEGATARQRNEQIGGHRK